MGHAEILGVELRWHLLQINIAAKSGYSLICFIYFNSRLNNLWCQLRPLLLCRQATIDLRRRVIISELILLEVYLFEDGKHQIVNGRKLSRELWIHCPHDGKLIRLGIERKTDDAAINNYALCLALIRTQLVENGHGIHSYRWT